MGRGRSSLGKEAPTVSKLLATLKDNTDFRAFIKENMSNSAFKQYGRDNSMDAVRELWYKKRTLAERKDLHEINIEDAIDKVRSVVPLSVVDGWFREANSGFKPKFMEYVLSNPGTLNAGMNMAYFNYKNSVKNPVSFKKWLNTRQTLYRGDRGQETVGGDVFLSYTPDKKVAQSFGSNISKVVITPIQTWGSYQTTAEQEFLIPIYKIRGRST